MAVPTGRGQQASHRHGLPPTASHSLGQYAKLATISYIIKMLGTISALSMRVFIYPFLPTGTEQEWKRQSNARDGVCLEWLPTFTGKTSEEHDAAASTPSEASSIPLDGARMCI